MSREFDFVNSALDPGLSVIEASARTGKTYAISHLVPRLLLDGSASRLGEILLVTFTNDAARELSDRVRRVLERLHAPPSADEAVRDNGVHRLRTAFDAERLAAVTTRALLDLDRLGVSTIHSFCQRTLQTDGVLCGLPVVPELIPSADEIIDEALYDFWNAEIASDPLLAAIASSEEWKLGDDLHFVRAGLGAPDAELVPLPGDLTEILEKIRACPEQFPLKLCEELREAFAAAKWKESSGPRFDQAARRLRDGGGAHAPGFLGAVAIIATAKEFLGGRSNAEKAHKQSILDLPIIHAAQDVVALLGRMRWAFRAHLLRVVREQVRDTLHRNRQITYDGLIEVVHDALRGPNGDELAGRLRDRYRVALIDESQDTDARQFAIFRRVFTGSDAHRLVLIGDPKQAIYAFRGADVNTYLAARDQAGKKVFHLTKTFRAPEPLVRAVNALFQRDGSLLKPGLDFFPAVSGLTNPCALRVDGNADEARIEAWVADDGKAFSNAPKRNTRIAVAVASEMVRLLVARAEIVDESAVGTSRLIGPGDMAVLVSSHEEARAMAEALAARGLPAIRAGAGDVLATEEASDLLMLLRALHEPRRTSLRMAALTTRMFGRTQADLQTLSRDAAADEEWLNHLLAWQATWHRSGIAPALADIDRHEQFTRRLAALEFGERRITNLRQLTDLLQAVSGELGHRPAHLVRWLSREIAWVSSTSPEERQQQIESDAAAVQIVTMHAAKGLEYPLVFCPFLWTSRKPGGIQKLSGSGGVQLVDLAAADPDLEAAAIRAAVEDRLRLAYVAITRAKVKVWIVAGDVAGKQSVASALDWLLADEKPDQFDTWRTTAAGPGRGERHRSGLEALAQAEIAIVDFPEPTDTTWTPSNTEEARHFATRPPPVIPTPWGLTSFSALTREKNPHAAEEPSDRTGRTDPTDQTDPSDSPAPGNSFLAAPGGTLVGTALHDWIERWDFGDFASGALASHLARYPISVPADGTPFAERVGGMLKDLRTATLLGLGCTVADACPDARSSEWHFQLPIGEALNSHRLAAVFADHGHAEYARRLTALPAEDIAGYLHGFLDRIAVFQGTWGVIDWKTNNLGPTPAHYGSDALLGSAMDSHYFLQTHLYLVALRRFLGPQARIAGAWLVYLRGIRADASDGILFIDPPSELLAALDALFSQPTPPRP